MKLEFTVPNLACSDCVETVTQAVCTVDGSAQVSADPKTKHVTVVTDAAEASIRDAIVAAGYTVA